jgi:hypothetical protein
MTTRSGDDGNQAAGRHGRLRASHDDREQIVTALKAAFVHGRLTQDELVTRTGQALAATTWADLSALTADLPGGGPAAPAVPAAAPPRRRPAGRSRRARAVRTAVLTVPPFAMVLAAILTQEDGMILPAILTLMLYWIVWAGVGLQAYSNWLDRRSARKSLPPPAAPRELTPAEEPPRPPYRGPLDGLILSERRRLAPVRPHPYPV